MNFPRMYRIRQNFDDTQIENIGQAVKTELCKLSLASIKAGQRVAISGGSRGIANIADILKAVVEHIKSLDAQPFIFLPWEVTGAQPARDNLQCWNS